MTAGRPRSKVCACCGIEKTPENTAQNQRGHYFGYAAYCRQCESDRVNRYAFRKMTSDQITAKIQRYERLLQILREVEDGEVTNTGRD